MDLITKQILANHQIRITESLRRAGLGESYYWLRLGGKAEMFSSVEEMVNRLNETVPAPWTVYRSNATHTTLVSDKFKDGTPFQAFKTEDTNTEVTQALDDAELRLLVSYRDESVGELSNGEKASILVDFENWSGGFSPRETTDEEILAYVKSTVDTSLRGPVLAFLRAEAEGKAETEEEPNPYCPGCGRVVSGDVVPDHNDDAHRSTNPGRLCPGSGKKPVVSKAEMGCAAVGGGAAGGFAVGTAHLPKRKKADDEESDAVQPVPPVEPVYANKPMLPKYLKKGKKEPKGDFRTQLMKGLKIQAESSHHEAPEVEDRINYGHGGYAGLVKEVGGYDVEKDAWIVIANDDKEHLIQPDKMDGDHMTWWTLSSKRVTAKAKPPISDEPDMAEGEDSDYYHPDDDTEPVEPTEPDEDDITTTDDNKWYQYGKLYHTGDRKSLAAKMDHDQFWPNVWSISDHGNTVLISADVADARKDSEEVVQSFNYEKKNKKKEAFGVTGTSNQGGMVQPLPKVGKGEPCWVCGTPIISTTSCHLCGADRE